MKTRIIVPLPLQWNALPVGAERVGKETQGSVLMSLTAEIPFVPAAGFEFVFPAPQEGEDPLLLHAQQSRWDARSALLEVFVRTPGPVNKHPCATVNEIKGWIYRMKLFGFSIMRSDCPAFRPDSQAIA